jgi:hypothetical protein
MVYPNYELMINGRKSQQIRLVLSNNVDKRNQHLDEIHHYPNFSGESVEGTYCQMQIYKQSIVRQRSSATFSINKKTNCQFEKQKTSFK